MPLADRLQAHIDELLEDHAISVVYRSGASPRAYRREHKVVLRPIKGRVTYFIALHEIGHVVGVNPVRRLEQEVCAWQWALEHARFEPTHEVWLGMHRRLQSYVDRAERRASMKLPAADHDFWILLERAGIEAGVLVTA